MMALAEKSEDLIMTVDINLMIIQFHLKITNVRLMVVLNEKSRDPCSGHHDYLHYISWPVIEIVKYLSLGRLTDRPTLPSQGPCR